MPNIFNYHDYRQFLGDFYNEKKSSSATFSYQNFLKKLVLQVSHIFIM
jgi:hypothetical protein